MSKPMRTVMGFKAPEWVELQLRLICQLLLSMSRIWYDMKANNMMMMAGTAWTPRLSFCSDLRIFNLQSHKSVWYTRIKAKVMQTHGLIMFPVWCGTSWLASREPELNPSLHLWDEPGHRPSSAQTSPSVSKSLQPGSNIWWTDFSELSHRHLILHNLDKWNQDYLHATYH